MGSSAAISYVVAGLTEKVLVRSCLNQHQDPNPMPSPGNSLVLDIWSLLISMREGACWPQGLRLLLHTLMLDAVEHRQPTTARNISCTENNATSRSSTISLALEPRSSFGISRRLSTPHPPSEGAAWRGVQCRRDTATRPPSRSSIESMMQ